MPLPLSKFRLCCSRIFLLLFTFSCFLGQIKIFFREFIGFIGGWVRSGRSLPIISGVEELFVCVILLHSLFIISNCLSPVFNVKRLSENVRSFTVCSSLRCSVCKPFFSKDEFHRRVIRQGLAISLGDFKILFIPSWGHPIFLKKNLLISYCGKPAWSL